MAKGKRKSRDRAKSRAKKQKPNLLTRFAHPFFDRDEPTFNKAAAKAAGERALQYVKQFLHAVPKPSRDPRFALSDVMTAAEVDDIATSGRIIVQLGGDTGMKEAATGEPTMQELVAGAMTKQFDIAHHTDSPAFFLHLGDVIYGPGKRVDGYKEQFYIPYKKYPGKIISIPGNHDGDWYPTDKPLEAWLENFCSAKRSLGATESNIIRQMPNQPGAYWMLDAPFVQFIGLYSNKLENPGYISGGKVGKHQRQWFVKTLKAIKQERQTTRKALVFATHHPPYSSGGHSGSLEMLEDIDKACGEAGIWPDLFLSGHAHSYQRYTRTVNVDGQDWKIPFLVIGCSGHGGQSVPTHGDGIPGVVYSHHYRGWGFSKFEFSPNKIDAIFYSVDHAGAAAVEDSFSVDLATHA